MRKEFDWQGVNLESHSLANSMTFHRSLFCTLSPYTVSLTVFSAAADIAENGSTDHQMGRLWQMQPQVKILLRSSTAITNHNKQLNILKL